MERVICSSSASCRLHSDSSLFRRFAGFDRPHKFPFSSSSTSKFQVHLSFASRRLTSLSADLHGSASVSVENHKEIAPASTDLRDRPEYYPLLLHQIAHQFSHQRKVFSSRTVILLSAISLWFISATVSPAFASFQAAKTGTNLIRDELLTSAWTGFLAGCLHTLSGPDHLAALAPLSIGRTSVESAVVGALWGCGHDAGQLIFGLLFLILKDKLHIQIIRTWGTRVVALTLLVIGAMGIIEASKVPEIVMEEGESNPSYYETKKKKIGFATFATGIVHGLQPDALLIILPALALPSRLAGAAFLFMFLIGTVVAMGSYTVFIGSCSQALKEKVPRITEKLTWASSFIAIGLGLAIIVSQFLGFSLY